MAKEKMEKAESLKDVVVKEEVDLGPRPEKITQEHLDQLQRLVNADKALQFNIGKLENQKHTVLHNLSMTQDRIGVFQDTLKKEYGTFDISIEDGTINYPKEETKKNEK